MKRTATILLVEDDPDVSDLIIEELTEHGFAVVHVTSGTAALALLQDRSAGVSLPDLILCDIGIPGLDGFVLLDQVIAEGDRLAAIPFVFVTALGSREHELAGRRRGADDYITKPIDFDLMVEIVKARLAGIARSQHTAAPELTDREIECLTWVARGKSSTDSAQIMGISERTVNFHVENASRKLDVAGRLQAALKAIRLGLIRP